jgi:hypothetical protein
VFGDPVEHAAVLLATLLALVLDPVRRPRRRSAPAR